MTTAVVNVLGKNACSVQLTANIETAAGGGGAEATYFYTRPTGNSNAANSSTQRGGCNAATSTTCDTMSEITEVLDSSAQFDYICRNTGALTAGALCFIYVKGYTECF